MNETNQYPGNDVQRYFDNEMSMDERVLFEAELSTNEGLRAELQDLENARRALIMYGIHQQVSAIRKERNSSTKKNAVIKISPIRRIFRYSIAAAACIVLILIGISKFNNPGNTPASLYAQQYIQFEPTISRDGTSGLSLLEKAYGEKNYGEVISLYNSQKSVPAREMIMTGSAYLETGNVVKAIETFRLLLNKNASTNAKPFNDDAMYYLALAYLRNKEYAKSIELMENIRGDEKSIYNNRFDETYINKVKKLNGE